MDGDEMQTIPTLLARIRAEPDCLVEAPTGQPKTSADHMIPPDVEQFYRLCGGARLFAHALFPLEVLPPQKVVPANPLIVGQPCSEDRSDSWYVIAHDTQGEYLSIDFGRKRAGRCYDSFSDRHGVPGSCPVIALSFTDLLERLLRNRGRHWYWLEPGFTSLGDAYDEPGQF